MTDPGIKQGEKPSGINKLKVKINELIKKISPKKKEKIIKTAPKKKNTVSELIEKIKIYLKAKTPSLKKARKDEIIQALKNIFKRKKSEPSVAEKVVKQPEKEMVKYPLHKDSNIISSPSIVG